MRRPLSTLLVRCALGLWLGTALAVTTVVACFVPPRRRPA